MKNRQLHTNPPRYADKRDQEWFIRIYDLYWRRLFLSCYRRVKDEAVAEELVQELFLKLWRKRDVLRIEQLEQYLFSSIRHATIDYLNRQMVANKYRSYQEIYTSMNENTTEQMVVLQDLEDALEAALQKLSGKSEAVYRLHRMRHWPIDRIARHLQLSEKTVRYHLTRSQKFLRAYLRHFTLLLLFVLLL